jgi:predicted RNase H-like HicB family nuclease
VNYHIVIVRLSPEDGDGYMGYAPDLKGCMSDGSTPEEALRNTQEAVQEWIVEQVRLGRPVPEPGSAHKQSLEKAANLRKAASVLLKHYEEMDTRVSKLAKEIADIKVQIDAAGQPEMHEFGSFHYAETEVRKKFSFS